MEKKGGGEEKKRMCHFSEWNFELGEEGYPQQQNPLIMIIMIMYDNASYNQIALQSVLISYSLHDQITNRVHGNVKSLKQQQHAAAGSDNINNMHQQHKQSFRWRVGRR